MKITKEIIMNSFTAKMLDLKILIVGEVLILSKTSVLQIDRARKLSCKQNDPSRSSRASSATIRLLHPAINLDHPGTATHARWSSLRLLYMDEVAFQFALIGHELFL